LKMPVIKINSLTMDYKSDARPSNFGNAGIGEGIVLVLFALCAAKTIFVSGNKNHEVDERLNPGIWAR
jgi:hypothetical protein